MKAVELAAAILDEAKTQIQANMAAHYDTPYGERWVNASGRSSEAWRVEVEETKARLVYEGDDVAPLQSIQDGTDEVPSLDEAARWVEEKTRSGAGNLPSPEAVVKGIALRGGTERHLMPQDWIVSPVIDTAVQALIDQIPAVTAHDIATGIF